MNEPLIFLKIGDVFKSIETKAVYAKAEMNKVWNVDFLQNTNCNLKLSL